MGTFLPTLGYANVVWILVAFWWLIGSFLVAFWELFGNFLVAFWWFPGLDDGFGGVMVAFWKRVLTTPISDPPPNNLI